MPPLLLKLLLRFAPIVKKDVINMENTGKKKMGRPTTDPKNYVARLRLSENEKHKLDECCKLTGLSITDVLKLGIEKVHQECLQK